MTEPTGVGANRCRYAARTIEDRLVDDLGRSGQRRAENPAQVYATRPSGLGRATRNNDPIVLNWDADARTVTGNDLTSGERTMASVRHFLSYTAARADLRSVIDAAHEGLITTITRDGERFVALPAAQRARELRPLLPEVCAIAEGGGWVALLPGVPVHGDAETFDGVVDDLITALREYAEDWNERLHRAVNHAQHRHLVEFVELSDDDGLRAWITTADQSPPAVLAAA